MRRGLVLVLLFAGCQGQGQEWLRRWNGSATLNDGRMPFTVAGTLDITTGAGSGSPLVFAFRGGMAGSSVEFVCPPGTVRSAMVTASTATVATGSTCTLTATPDDGCTRDLTFNSGELTLTQSGATLTGMGSMRLTLACPGAGSSTSDVGFMLTAR